VVVKAVEKWKHQKVMKSAAKSGCDFTDVITYPASKLQYKAVIPHKT